MKIQLLKSEVFRLTSVSKTSELKKKRSDLTQGLDLRYKKNWFSIYSRLIEADVTLDKLEQEDIEMKQALHRMGRVTGLSAEAVENTWEEIQKTSQIIEDITLEELEV